MENPIVAPPIAVGRRTARRPRATAAPATDKVNINTADVKALMIAQRRQPQVAERIVTYRDAHGPFKKAGRSAPKVEGVGDGVWEKNRARISVK